MTSMKDFITWKQWSSILSWLNPCSRFICSIRATAIGIMWVTARWSRENSFQDQRNYDMAVKECEKKYPR